MGLFSGLLGNAGTVSPEELQEKYSNLLIDGEQVDIGFILIRDTFIFTNKRLILVDIQGMTGRKTEYLSIPYKSISKFSIETAGHFDLDAELKIWIGSDTEPVEKKFNQKVNIYDLQKVLASHTLG
ncbi:PH domain-containing protein [Spongorhabdus nitratireducens]